MSGAGYNGRQAPPLPTEKEFLTRPILMMGSRATCFVDCAIINGQKVYTITNIITGRKTALTEQGLDLLLNVPMYNYYDGLEWTDDDRQTRGEKYGIILE